VKTALDDAKSWFLQELRYSGELHIVLAEGIRASETEDITVGDHVISGTYALEPRDTSRIVVVTFPRIVAWQLVDESFTAFDDYEQRDDDSFLQILSRSHYLDYMVGSGTGCTLPDNIGSGQRTKSSMLLLLMRHTSSHRTPSNQLLEPTAGRRDAHI
jgi:hypothetical protein